MLQRRPAKQAHLRDIGRAHTRLAALAFDAFNHGRLFATDIRTGATAQINSRQRARRIGLQSCDFVFQDGTAAVVFIAQIDVAGVYANHLGGNEHAF